jgi:hypothetical protein
MATLSELLMQKQQARQTSPTALVTATGNTFNPTSTTYSQASAPKAPSVQSAVTSSAQNTSVAKPATNEIASAVANGATKSVATDMATPEKKAIPQAQDNTDLINQQSDSMAAAIRAQIAQRSNDMKVRKSQLSDKYQGDKNASEVAKFAQTRSLNEMAANAGDRGGIGRQNALAAMVGGENRLNTINLAQKQEEAALNNEIGKLMLEGDIQQAQIQAQRLRDLIANNTAMNNTNYERQFNQEGRDISNSQFTQNLDQRNKEFGQTQDNADRAYKLTLANDMGKTFDANGNMVDSAATVRQREQDALDMADKEKKDYLESIKGLGDQFDYAAEIEKIINDNDTSNDWKIPYLKQEREAKVQNTLKEEVATIGQYSNDYQAEINKRAPNDPLLPYLKTAQLQKIASMQTASANAQEAQMKQAMDIWVKMGVATPEVAAVLGIPAGAQTSDYGVDQANIRQSDAAASASMSKASGTAGASGASTKKSPYFDSVSKSIDSYISGLKGSQDNANKPLTTYLSRPGTVEHKQFSTIIGNAVKNGLITADEGELMFNFYGVPY